MSEFKLYDRVIFKGADGFGDCVVGKEYVVDEYTQASPQYGEATVRVGTHTYYAYRFELVQQCNGVDREGKPLNFTEDMLKPFMRVVDTQGESYVVTVSDSMGKPVLVHPTGFINFYLDKSECYDYEDYVARAVYDVPAMYSDYLNPSMKGSLIWKRTPPKTAEQLAQEAAVAARNKAIEEAEKALKLAQDKLSELKQSF